jgi:hypothetical protein
MVTRLADPRRGQNIFHHANAAHETKHEETDATLEELGDAFMQSSERRRKKEKEKRKEKRATLYESIVSSSHAAVVVVAAPKSERSNSIPRPSTGRSTTLSIEEDNEGWGQFNASPNEKAHATVARGSLVAVPALSQDFCSPAMYLAPCRIPTSSS